MTMMHEFCASKYFINKHQQRNATMKEKREIRSSADEFAAPVYKTTRYDKFKLLDGNRSVKTARVRRILESIQKVGYRMVPIVVNKDYEVIDGQGRLAALRELGLPVYYVVDYGAGIEECRMLNIGMTNWSLTDFIDSYAELGNPEYMEVLPLVREYGDLGFNITTMVCGGSYNQPHAESVRFGRFKMKRSREVATDWLERFRVTKQSLKSVSGEFRYLFGAMIFAVEVCKADKTRMFDRVNGIPEGSVAGLPSSMIGACRMLEGIYNHHLSSDRRIYFAAEWDKWMRSHDSED